MLLNNKGDSKQPCFAPYFKGIISMLLMTDGDFWSKGDIFYSVKEFVLSDFFFHEWVLHFVNCLLNICDDHIFPYYINIINYIHPCFPAIKLIIVVYFLMCDDILFVTTFFMIFVYIFIKVIDLWLSLFLFPKRINVFKLQYS